MRIPTHFLVSDISFGPLPPILGWGQFVVTFKDLGELASAFITHCSCNLKYRLVCATQKV